MTQKEKLQLLKTRRNPDQLTDDILSFLAGRIESYNVEPLIPEKGEDYFTEADVEEIVSRVRAMVRDGIDGKDGKDGKDGRDGKDGATGKMGPPGRDGKDGAVGKTGPAGAPGKDGVSPKIEEVAKMAVELINSNPDQEFVTVKKLVEFLKRGGFRGGAGSGTGVNQPVYSDTVTGTIDGVNQTFTVATTINTAFALYLANSVYQPNVDFTYSGTTITMTTAPDASLSGQPFWILHN